MSRFANPKATERFVLGPCECPGEPHDDDWINLRSELGADDVAKLVQGNSIDALELLAVEWNLLDHDGTVAPLDRAHIERLYADTFEKLDKWVTAHVRITSLPNVSGAPSANGSRGSASAIRTTQKRQ